MHSLKQALETWPSKITHAQVESITNFLDHNGEGIRSINWYAIENKVYFVVEHSGDTYDVTPDGTIQLYRRYTP